MIRMTDSAYQVTLVGVMGWSPGPVTFTMDSSPGPSELAVTVQKSGGSLTPAKHFVASGPVVAS
jgi:hypothetical protein